MLLISIMIKIIYLELIEFLLNLHTCIWRKGMKFPNVKVVWNWWYKLIYCFCFTICFIKHVLLDSIDIWNCRNQDLRFYKGIIIKCFGVKSFELRIKKQNCNFWHSVLYHISKARHSTLSVKNLVGKKISHLAKISHFLPPNFLF